MRIGIDARFLTHPQYGGFKTYTQQLIAALGAIDRDDTFVLYVDRPMTPNAAAALPSRATLRVVRGDLPLVGMPWREQWALPRAIGRDRLDVFHAPALTAPLCLPCPLVVTIHDTIWLHQRTGRSPRRRLLDGYQRTVARRVARRAAAVLTVSRASKADIVAELDVAADRVAVTYEAAGPIFRPVAAAEIERLRRRYDLPARFILALASADPRKNLRGAVAAYALLPAEVQRAYGLVILWSSPARDRLARLPADAAGSIHALPAISDDDLPALYAASALFLFPSLAEGFGLPLLEAMACGTPVVAADNSSLPEIAGDAAVLTPATDPRAMAAAIARVLQDDDARRALIEAGQRQARSFSWTRCAEQTLEVYKRAAGHGGGASNSGSWRRGEA